MVTHRHSERIRDCNDLVFDARGRLYFIDQGHSGMHMSNGRIYRFDPDTWQLDLLIDTGQSPTGPVLNEAEDALYVAMTSGNSVWRLPLIADGMVSKVGVFVQLSGPDGLALDREGGLWIAHAGNGRVWGGLAARPAPLAGAKQDWAHDDQPRLSRTGQLRALHHRVRHRAHPSRPDPRCRQPDLLPCDRLRQRAAPSCWPPPWTLEKLRGRRGLQGQTGRLVRPPPLRADRDRALGRGRSAIRREDGKATSGSIGNQTEGLPTDQALFGRDIDCSLMDPVCLTESRRRLPSPNLRTACSGAGSRASHKRPLRHPGSTRRRR